MKDTYYLVSVLFRSTYCNDPSVPVIVILLILSEWSYTHPDFSDSKDSVILILLILSLWSWSYPTWMILLILLLWSYWTCVSNSTEGLPLWSYWSWLCDLACWSCLNDPTDPELVILLFLVDWSYWSSIYISFMTTQDLYRDHYLSACSGFLCSVKCVGNCLLLQQQDNQWIDLRTLSHLYVKFLDMLHNRHDRFKTTMKTVDWAVIFI